VRSASASVCSTLALKGIAERAPMRRLNFQILPPAVATIDAPSGVNA
jgi:hypothetical protein